MTNASLWVDYIFLDTDERRRFAQLSHEYLIEQLQFTGEEAVSATNNRVKLNFNHPCKELVWVIKSDAKVGASNWYNFTSDASDPTAAAATNLTTEAKLQLNGHDRFAPRKGDYFKQDNGVEKLRVMRIWALLMKNPLKHPMCDNTMLVASWVTRFCHLARHTGCGNILRAYSTKVGAKATYWPREQLG